MDSRKTALFKMTTKPYVTLKMDTKKDFGKSEIIWKKTINSEFISNNIWHLKICAICIFNVKKSNTANIDELGKFNFSIKTNMTRQPYLWYSKTQNLSEDSNNLAIELFSVPIKELEHDFTHEKFSNNCHPINSIDNFLEITCQNLSQQKYKLEDFEFNALVLINLFKS